MWQPHTSAGRVPTDLGYRFYVDLLLEARRATRDRSSVEARLRAAGRRRAADRRRAVDARRTCCPRRRTTSALRSRRPTSRPSSSASSSCRSAASRVLVVMVSRGDQVSQKVVDIGEPIAPSELRAGRQLPQHASSPAAARPRCARRVLARLREERTLYDQLLARGAAAGAARRSSIGTTADASTSTAPRRCSTSADVAQSVSLPTLRALLRMVEEKQRLVRLLERVHRRPGPDRRHRRRAQRPRPARRSA